MKSVICLVFFLISSCTSLEALAYACKDATGNEVSHLTGDNNVTATSSVYVNLDPEIRVGQNLIVDLSKSITCQNTDSRFKVDHVLLRNGSTYGGALSNFSGSMTYNGSYYDFPLTSDTGDVTYSDSSWHPWPAVMYLTPVTTAGGIVIKAGSLFAILHMHQYYSDPKTGVVSANATTDFYWNLYANNDVVVPTGGCDVSARDVTVTLPVYPGTVAVPLTVHCAATQNLNYYLSGTTANTAATIFTNTASGSAATGIGVQLSNQNGVLAANHAIALGQVGTTPVSLGLTASYARTSGQVTAGQVQSIVGVTFAYQ